MKKKRKLGRKLLSFLLTLAMLVGLVPGMGMTALAATETYTALKNDATVVHFHNSDWYIIADDSTSATEGTVTLLSADESFGMSVFNSEANNSYNASAVKAYLSRVVAGTAGEGKPNFSDVAGAIEPVDLTTYNYNSTTEVKETTDGAKLYLLDTAAANGLHDTIKSDGFEGVQHGFWWLRSPGQNDSKAAFGVGETGEVYAPGDNVTNQFGVRPALKLDLSKVTFDSVSKTFSLNSASNTTEYTTLQVGDVLRVGDTINSTTEYDIGGFSLYPDSGPWTMVRADFSVSDSELNVTESATGAYYLFKGQEEDLYTVGYDTQEIFGAYFAATETSDGIYVTSISGPAVSQMVSFVVHEPVTGVTLTPNTAQTIDIDGTVAFTASITPDNATDKKVKWSVGGTNADAVSLYSDENCTTEVGTDATSTLTVYAKGISAGSATITATSNADNTKSASCDVTVNAAASTSISFVKVTDASQITADNIGTCTYDQAKAYAVANLNTLKVNLSGSQVAILAFKVDSTIKAIAVDSVSTEPDDYSSQDFSVDNLKSFLSDGDEIYLCAPPAPAAYSVTITPGNNMTKTETSGDASQTGLSGAMTDVVYTADEGYKFPETDDAYTTTNGITVAVSQDLKTITVSGTPIANTEITIPDAVEDTASDDPYATLLNTTTVVKFDGKEWYLIENESTALKAGTVTLLSKECVDASDFGSNNTYSGSDVETAVNNYYTNSISSNVKSAIVDSKMFLLTIDQAKSITNDEVRKCSQYPGSDGNVWWLRSPGNDAGLAACVNGESGNVDDFGLDVGPYPHGVRPALKLNLPSVIFSSVNLSGGANTEISGGTATQNYFDMGNTRGAMTTVTYTAKTGYKFPKESDVYTETNGITVAVSQDQKTITVSGTPTATATSIAVPDAVVDPLADAKTSAKADLDTLQSGKNQNDYDAADWTTLTQAITDGKTAIDNETTIDGVNTAKSNAVDAVNAVKTKAQKLEDAKTSAKADLDTLQNGKNQNDYDAADWTTLTQAITDGKTAIDNATTIEAVTTAKNNAIDAVNAVKTKAQKLADAKTTAVNTVNAVNANDYIAADQQTVTDAKTTALAAIEAATTEEEVTTALNNFNNAIASCTTQVVADQIAQVMSEVSAKTGSNMTYTGNPIQMINAPTTKLPEGYKMVYAVTTENKAPTDEKLYTTDIPTKTDAGTYYVWYKVVGDENHNDVEPKSLVVTINEKQQTSNGTITTDGIYCASNHPSIQAGMVIHKSNEADTVEYRWVGCDSSKPGKWFEVSPWTKDNNWMNWTPEKSGSYVFVCYARVVGNEEESLIQYAFGTEYHRGIKGICQMPYSGEGGGYLIGIESYNNPNNSYQYEMLILDCSLLAQGKDAWIYTTGKCGSLSNCLWTVWQPKYGYYWTLFRIYDADGNMIDEQCYGFANIF